MDILHHTTHNKKTDQRGFTLLEMLVAVFVFVIVVVAMFDLFMMAQRAQRTAASFENLQDDLRFSLNRITDEVRDGGIDYAAYAKDGITIDPVAGNNELIIRTFSGASMRFKSGTGPGDCIDPAVSPETKRCLLIQENSDAPEGDPARQWRSLTSDGVSVSGLKFYITPANDPFEFDFGTNTYKANSQPRVRITVAGSSKVRESDSYVTTFLQTLISTREYRR